MSTEPSHLIHASHPNSIGLQRLKPLLFRPPNVAAEAATHKDRLQDTF
jgi:hypothetical protein